MSTIDGHDMWEVLEAVEDAPAISLLRFVCRHQWPPAVGTASLIVHCFTPEYAQPTQTPSADECTYKLINMRMQAPQ